MNAISSVKIGSSYSILVYKWVRDFSPDFRWVACVIDVGRYVMVRIVVEATGGRG